MNFLFKILCVAFLSSSISLNSQEQNEEASKQFSISRVDLGKAPEQREEVSPHIERIDIIESERKIAVFLEGWVDADCFEQREVEIRGNADVVEIVPRFMRKNFKKACRERSKKFAQKVYDFRKEDALPKSVRILGFMGWYERVMPQIESDANASVGQTDLLLDITQ